MCQAVPFDWMPHLDVTAFYLLRLCGTLRHLNSYLLIAQRMSCGLARPPEDDFFTKSGAAMSSRVQGTVKWFSNKKGYGFIEPTSENSPTKEDIFVHQSSVTSDGYRTLVSPCSGSFHASGIFQRIQAPTSMRTQAFYV